MTTKIVIIGGFLGSGKTTTLLRLADTYLARGQRVGIITNDQAVGLVDTERFRFAGYAAGEVAGGCFCCRFDDFVARADELMAATEPDLILAEPVGSCTDLVATVLHPLERYHGERFSLAPFTVLVDPLRALALLGGEGPPRLSEKIAYIYRLQQLEADAIAINKIDLLSSAQRDRVQDIVGRRFPEARIFTFSAQTGEGFEELATYIDGSRTPGDRALSEIDYDIYAAGEAELGWLNRSMRLRAREPVGVDAAVLDLARATQESLSEEGVEIAHAKFMLRGDRKIAAANVVGAGQPAHLSHEGLENTPNLDLLVNLRALGPPLIVQRILDGCLLRWQDKHHLDAISDDGHAFAPARPVPSHRIPALG